MKIFVIVAFILIALTISAFLIFNNKTSQISNSPLPTSNLETPTDIKASFQIITDNITRSFTNPKYHDLSEDVFITSSDPTVVHVKKSDITWSDFFATLPMKLTKTCLTTGDGETYCDSENGTLKFYINDVEDKDLLDKEIKDSSSILIKFTSK